MLTLSGPGGGGVGLKGPRLTRFTATIRKPLILQYPKLETCSVYSQDVFRQNFKQIQSTIVVEAALFSLRRLKD